MINYNLPVWNGVKETTSTRYSTLEIDYSKDDGVFRQANDRIIEYDNKYEHMTPIIGGTYISGLRDEKINWVLKDSNIWKNILEIGGGDAYNYKQFNCDKYTIVDPVMAETHATDKLRVIPEYFEKVSLSEKYDLIIMFSLLEHVDSPNLVIEKSANCLTDSGSIYISIPIIDTQFKIGDFNVLVHEHTHYFTARGARNLFARHNLVVDAYYFKNDVGYFKLLKGNHDTKTISIERVSSIAEPFARQYGSFIDIFETNEKLLFYGATNGLNNLLYLASKDIEIDFEQFRIADSDSNKWGKYISSHMMPILSPESISNYKTICISAPSFYNDILSSIPKNKIIISTIAL